MNIKKCSLRTLAGLASIVLLTLFFAPQPVWAQAIVKMQSYNYPSLFWRAAGTGTVLGQDVNPENHSDWKIVPGLANAGAEFVSFQAVGNPGFYLRQSNYMLVLAQPDGTAGFAADATFRKVPGLKDASYASFQSYRYPQKYIRHYQDLRLDTITTDTQMQDATFKIVADDCGGIGLSAEDQVALQSCTGNPTVCTVGGSDGNVYNVAMRFDSSYDGPLEVFGESRRRLFVDGQKGAGGSRCVNVLVDVRDYQFEGEPLQPRDPGIAGLNLRIAQGTGLTALSARPVASPVTIFIAGDSTVADQPPQLTLAPAERYTGWGGMIPAFFNNQVTVANYADSGEGTKAFRVDGGFIWYKIDARLKAGDWVLIQLGHNDKNTGAELYRSRILGMINAVKSKGAYPVLVTPMVRNNGVALASQHVYGDLNVRHELSALADSENVALIDLMALSSEWVASIGKSAAQGFFVGSDTTHASEAGAKVFAQMIADDIRSRNLELATYLRD